MPEIDSHADVDHGGIRREGRSWMLAGVALLLLGFALGIVVGGDRVFPGELALLQWMHQRPNEVMDRAAWWASRLGDSYSGLMAITVLTALWCFWQRRLDLALFLVIASVLRVLGPPLKWVFESARPPLDLHAVIEPVNGLGYPSGHTLGAVLIYGAAFLAVPQTLPSSAARWATRILCLLLLALIPWSRMRLGVHWPSDIAGGYLFGMGMVALLWALLPWLWERMATVRGSVGKSR